MKKLRSIIFPLTVVVTVTTIPNVEKADTREVSPDEIVIKGDYHLVKAQEIFDRLIEEEKQRKLELERLAEEKRLAELNAPRYNPYDLRERSNLTKEQMHQILSGTALETLVDAYYWYEQEYNVNALFIMSLNAHESSWGTSELAMYKNNLGGYKTSDGSYKYFNDWGEFLQENFRLIGEEYLNPNGLFFNGGYDIYSINPIYCPDPSDYSWSEGINKVAYELLSKIYK